MRVKCYLHALLLVAVVHLYGCAASDDVGSPASAPGERGQTWTVTAAATQDSIRGIGDADEATRAIFYGGNTRRWAVLWDEGDVVSVYKNGAKVGEMTPQESSWGNFRGTLTGTLTGSFAANDVLQLYLPDKAMDFTGQDGTINNVSALHGFQTANATVTAASNGALTLYDVAMNHRQSYLRFVLTDSETGARLHPSRLDIIPIQDGTALLSMDAAGNVTSSGTLTVNTTVDNGEYPSELFVAMANVNDVRTYYKLQATVGSDIYVGPIEAENAVRPSLPKGQLTRILRQMQKTTNASTLTIADIPSEVFTGYAHEPVLSVKDGEDALTLNTDYSVDYSGNTNVGTATAIITGMALSTTTQKCLTPYIGTQGKTFQITKATPVVTIDQEAMTLVYGHETGTRVRNEVHIDNSALSLADFDITDAATVRYSSANESIATVNAETGEVTATGLGTTTITATVQAADNWTTATTSYTVNVEGEVNTGNSVSPWGNGGTGGGKIFVE